MPSLPSTQKVIDHLKAVGATTGDYIQLDGVRRMVISFDPLNGHLVLTFSSTRRGRAVGSGVTVRPHEYAPVFEGIYRRVRL